MSIPYASDHGKPSGAGARRSKRAPHVDGKVGSRLRLAISPATQRSRPRGIDGRGDEGHYARALERANEELKRANRELEEFAYVASHDLREPLRMVNIYTELLIEQCGQSSEQARQFAKHIQYSVARMERLIQDVLHYSQTVHEGLEDTVAPVPLRRSLEHALAVFRDRLDTAAAEIEIGQLPVVLADEMQIALVFQNLLSNSIKYADPERKLRIRIWAEPRGGEWTIHLADNGIGFEPQFGERIFGLFKRLHGRDVPGTGLGLAICRRIIERHGGQIRADGMVQQGATFTFTLKGSSHHGAGVADPAGRGQSR
jgi:light-regulated signal transduction histidine kinase (bacteriophytochrome)